MILGPESKLVPVERFYEVSLEVASEVVEGAGVAHGAEDGGQVRLHQGREGVVARGGVQLGVAFTWMGSSTNIIIFVLEP